MLKVDLNSDLGEGFGNYYIGNDDKVLDYVSSVNIACGFHAGDPLVMEKTVKMAMEKEVAIGAHPGFPDLMGFGRRVMNISHEEARAYMIYQLGALKGFVESYGANIQHVKPHGALYNMATKDYELAKTLARAVYDVDKDLIFMGLSGSIMIKAAEDVGLKTANEFFADRGYNPDGTLVSRSNPGAMIHETDKCVQRVLHMIREGKVKAIDGTDVSLKVDSVCVHGDNIKAIEFTKVLREKLQREGVDIMSLKPIRELVNNG